MTDQPIMGPRLLETRSVPLQHAASLDLIRVSGKYPLRFRLMALDGTAIALADVSLQDAIEIADRLRDYVDSYLKYPPTVDD